MSKSPKQRQPDFFFNPHRHVKVWFSSKPDVFMNTENQMRLMAMRDLNPNDEITLVYDSSLLSQKAQKDLADFCKNQNLKPIDMVEVESQLKTEPEKELYHFYKDEITHLKEGGNLAVASDIVRWLEPIYSLGTYTDFDVPVDTSELPAVVRVQAPLLTNIGSVRILGEEMVLSNNDFISVVDPNAALGQIEKVQNLILEKLKTYSSDFMEKSEEAFSGKGPLKRMIFNIMKNRNEPAYIEKSNDIFKDGKKRSSREIRNYIYETMTDVKAYLDFKRKEHQHNLQAIHAEKMRKEKNWKKITVFKAPPTESDEDVIKRLRAELKKQLSITRRLFFKRDFDEINKAFRSCDKDLLAYVMKKERTVYLESLVICTTGPITISKALFGNYVFKPKYFSAHVEDYSFKKYKLEKQFASANSMKLHENLLGMMRFLSADPGKLNDSSWLESGIALQGSREEQLKEYKNLFKRVLPYTLFVMQKEIERHLRKIEKQEKSHHTPQRAAKILALQKVLTCFNDGRFDVQLFRQVFDEAKRNKKTVFASSSTSHVKQLLTLLDKTRHEATILDLVQDKKLQVNKAPVLQERKNKRGASFFTPVVTKHAPKTTNVSSAEPQKNGY
jgi:glucosyltransferase Lgt1/2/3